MIIRNPPSPLEFWQSQNGDASGQVNDTSTQNWFASSSDELTLPVGTYDFEALLEHATGTTSTFMNMLFGGTATFTVNYFYSGTRIAIASASPTGAGFQGTSNVKTAQVVCNTAGNSGVQLYLRGTLKVTAAGTIIPQYSYNAATGSGAILKDGSYFRVRKLTDATTLASIGPWS